MMDFQALSQQCAPLVDHKTMAAIVRTESSFNPLAINVNGSSKLERQPRTVEEAVVTAKWLVQSGFNIDVGLAQVNSKNLVKVGLSVEDAFDPCKNLAAGAAILKGNYERARQSHATEQGALKAAISAYNTGDFSRGFSNGYVQKVIYNAGGNRVVPIPLAAGAAGKGRVSAKRSHRPGQEKRDDSWNVYSGESEGTFQ